MLTIGQVDVRDDSALRAWYAVEAASVDHDRPDAGHRSFESLAAAVQHPSTHQRYLLLAAREGTAVVGTAYLTLRDAENAHALELEIHVHPGQRRNGIGRRLWAEVAAIGEREGRTTFFGELTVPPPAGLAFAKAMGFDSVHEEDHLILELPHEVEPMPTPGYEIVTWTGRCPEELLAAYVRLRNQMELDVPIGDVDLAPSVYTAERIREQEDRTARSYERITAAARDRTTGDLVAYSLVFLPFDSTDVIQDDTLVMPSHRGHRLGHALKRTTLELIRHGYPERRRIHSWTAPENDPMRSLNATFGFRAVDRVHEVQRRA